MKKNILGLVFLISFSGFSQEYKPLKIYHKKDDMKKTDLYYPSRRLVYADTITKSGSLEIQSFGANLTLEVKKGALYFDGITIKCNTIGCIDNGEIIFLFDNEQTIEKHSNTKFNCDGNAFFTLTAKEIELLSNNKVKKIRITNGLNNKSVTGIIDEPDYFITLIDLLKNNQITEK